MPNIDRTVVVVRVIDGDSLIVRYLNQTRQFQVRLFGIDAPEHDQEHGDTATWFLNQQALLGSFRLRVHTPSDRYGRVVGVLYADRILNSLNHQMVAAGLAWAWERYGTLEGIVVAQNHAKAQKLGTWEREGAIPPWVHRNPPSPPKPRPRERVPRWANSDRRSRRYNQRPRLVPPRRPEPTPPTPVEVPRRGPREYARPVTKSESPKWLKYIWIPIVLALVGVGIWLAIPRNSDVPDYTPGYNRDHIRDIELACSALRRTNYDYHALDRLVKANTMTISPRIMVFVEDIARQNNFTGYHIRTYCSRFN